MKLWPDLFRARASAATPDTPPHKPAGASGTINMSGFLVPDEYNDDLRWPQSLAIYQKMLRGDAAVREAYQHTMTPILNATWDIDPASDEPQDLEIAEMVRRAYFEWPVSPFKQTMALTLKYLAQGFQMFELTEQVVEASLIYEDPKTGNPVTVPSRQFVTWKRWEHRRPETVFKWDTVDGELTDIVQIAFKDGNYGEWTIPAETIALFVNEQEGDDFTGVSLLRSVYKSWFEKDLVEKVMVMAVERHGLGVNVGYNPDDARNDATMVDRMDSMLAGLKAGQSSHLVFPGPKQQSAPASGSAASGYLFEIVTPPGGLPNFVPILNYLRGDIKGAVLARFSELGHSATSSKSGGNTNTQAEIWYAALHATADYVASVHNEKIKQLVLRNYADVERFPQLVPRDIESKSLAQFAQANAQLVAAGAIVPDSSYRAFIRAGMDAPDEDELTPLQDPAIADPTLTEPPGAGGADPAEKKKRQDQQAADNAAAIARVVVELEQAADNVVAARRKDERVEVADVIRGMVEAIKAIPAPTIEVMPQHHAHQHDHHERHEGLTADQLEAALAAERLHVDEEIATLVTELKAKTVVSQRVDRDPDTGRLVAIREYDAEGELVRSRRITAHNDDGTVKHIEED